MAKTAAKSKTATAHEQLVDVNTTAAGAVGVVEVTATVPLAPEIEANVHITRHIDTRLGRDEALALKRLHRALDAAQATLSDGKRVTSPPLAVRWLLQRIAAGSESDGGVA